MAQTYNCDVCHDVAADYMVTNIQTGESIAVGVECLLEWALPLAEAFHEAVESSQRHEGQSQAPLPADAVEWEADYPQGRREADGAAEGSEGDDGGEGAETSSPADVGG